MSAVVELAQELIRYNTVNPPGNEEPAMRHLGAYLDGHGLEVEYQRLSDNRANLIARIEGRGQGHLVLCRHMDVVHPGEASWEHDPFAGELVDGKLFGRGATDMKGGVAAMAVAVCRLAKQGFQPAGDVILAVTCGEEVDMAGARLLGQSSKLEGARYVVIGEPTGLDVFHAEKGVLWLRITASGHTAHGAMPHLGVNAISFVARLVQRLEAYPFPFQTSDILGDPTVSANVIQGGVKTNVVADRCSVEVDFRLVPGQERDSMLNDIDVICEEIRREVPATVSIEVIQDVPAVRTPANSPLVHAVVAAVRDACGSPPAVGGVAYGTDGALIAPNLGADLVICGPGGVDQLHQPDEWVAVSQLEEAADVYARLSQALLA